MYNLLNPISQTPLHSLVPFDEDSAVEVSLTKTSSLDVSVSSCNPVSITTEGSSLLSTHVHSSTLLMGFTSIMYMAFCF